MDKVTNPYDVINGKTYKIVFPCYDDYNEGLSPEIDIVIINSRNKNGLIVSSMNSDNTYELKWKMLLNYEIYSL
jgi:hypothetical protein